MKKKYAALFCRRDSAYKDRPHFDVWDAERDATKYDGDLPVVAHPPCRAWGALSHMSFRSHPNAEELRKAERELAIFAVDQVRRCGGILEHPAKSKLFKGVLPDVGDLPDEFGGYTIWIDQFDFGHVANKPTKIYICGTPLTVALPEKRSDEPTCCITGFVPHVHGKYLKRCTQYQREYTPDPLIDWFELVLEKICPSSKG